MILSEQIQKIAVEKLISEKTEGLKDDQASRIVTMFEDKSFSDVKKNIDGIIDVIVEEENTVDETIEETTNTIIDGDGIEVTPPTIIEEEEDSMITIAKKYV